MSKLLTHVLIISLCTICFIKELCAQEPYNPLSELSINERLLIQYADSNSIEVVALCLKNGTNVNAATFDGVTSLILAVQNRNYYMVSLLLGYGANPNIKLYDGTSALHIAAMYGMDSIAVLLQNSKANINEKNDLGLTPLHYSVWNGFPYLSDILVQGGAAIDTADFWGNTPLLLSVYNGTNGCAQVLLEYGANPNKPDLHGITPLMVAAQFNDTIQIKYLINFGADIKQKDRNGYDALSYAISNNSTDAVKCLLAYKQSSVTTKSYTQLAIETRNQDIKKIINDSGIRGKLRPSIEGLKLGIETISGSHIFMWGLSLGSTESLTGINISTHFLFNPYRSSILVNRDNRLYQFKEKRRIIGLTISREQDLFRNNQGSTFGFYYGCGPDVITRNFRATKNDPKTRIYLNARAGLYRKKTHGEIQIGWDFTSLRTIDTSPHRLGINLLITIPSTNKNVKTKNIHHVY